MSEGSNREVVERYAQAWIQRDLVVMDRLRHADYVAEWPQSGERVRGVANARAILDHYPGGLPAAEKVTLRGSEDRWVTTPVGTLLRITGTGDVYTIIYRLFYSGDSRPWHVVSVVELRDGKVVKETEIFGAEFDPPAWRAAWVERM